MGRLISAICKQMSIALNQRQSRHTISGKIIAPPYANTFDELIQNNRSLAYVPYHVHDTIDLFIQRQGDKILCLDRTEWDTERRLRCSIVWWGMGDKSHGNKDRKKIEPDSTIGEPAIILRGTDERIQLAQRAETCLQGANLTNHEPNARPDNDTD